MSTSYGLSLPYVNPFTLASQTCYAYAAQINLCPAGQTGQITFLIYDQGGRRRWGAADRLGYGRHCPR